MTQPQTCPISPFQMGVSHPFTARHEGDLFFTKFAHLFGGKCERQSHFVCYFSKYLPKCDVSKAQVSACGLYWVIFVFSSDDDCLK